jgi:hypothetical protein
MSGERSPPNNPAPSTEAAERVAQLEQEFFDVVAVAMNPRELLIAFGRVRQGITEMTGAITIQGVDWNKLISLSPATARLLHLHLDQSLRQYEQQFGKIPSDPLYDTLKEQLNADTKQSG